ncbi:hypothetical protein GJ496_000295 [Pomphorhynchus laevis]|nr:hypothetical protein GJ496_006888 [Pomphorhynchus laevis]KAI0985394.1 hypothetical protein GJ496_000295 [Pomphorhynchus laevis]
MIIPKCNAGKEFVGHLTNLVNELVEKSPRCKYVLHLLTVFCQLILQKIHSKRTKDCRKAIEKRLDIWNRGSYSELLNEARYLQSLMKSKLIHRYKVMICSRRSRAWCMLVVSSKQQS